MAFNVQLYRPNSAQTAFEAVYVATKPSLVEGLVGADNKILTSMLPSYILGGMRFVGLINSNKNLETLRGELMAWATNQAGAGGTGEPVPVEAFPGKYFVATKNVKITAINEDVFRFGEEGDPMNTTEVNLEIGDRLVFESYESGSGLYTWGVINNTYADATTTAVGVVRMATEAEAVAGDIVEGDRQPVMTPYRTSQWYSNAGVNQAIQTALDGKQDKHNILTNLSGLDSSVGLVKKTGTDTFIIDQSDYATTSGVAGAINSNNQDLMNNIIPDVFAKKDSETLTGAPKAPTPSPADNSTRIATTKFVKDQNYITSSQAPVQGVKGDSETSFRTGEVNITKANIGLSNVSNYGVANETEAKVGISNAKYMTPLRTKEAIDHLASIPYFETLPTFNASNFPAGKLIMVKV